MTQGEGFCAITGFFIFAIVGLGGILVLGLGQADGGTRIVLIVLCIITFILGIIAFTRKPQRRRRY